MFSLNSTSVRVLLGTEENSYSFFNKKKRKKITSRLRDKHGFFRRKLGQTVVVPYFHSSELSVTAEVEY